MTRCDHPGCESRATMMYLVGLGDMQAFYCFLHAPKPADDDTVLSHHERFFPGTAAATTGREQDG